MTSQRLLFLIEPDPVLVEIITGRFSHYGFAVASYQEGLAAWRKSYELVPNVVLSELRLPDVSGVELIRLLRSAPRLANTQIVIFTNYPSRADCEDCLSAGASKFFSKNEVSLQRLPELVSGNR
ncbi:MAG: response regulator [Candidatus Doudnabacteria bacterium]|nr:response regulator [Candidatus Doudnabacteria bacterium]